jgi:hypothetical protein
VAHQEEWKGGVGRGDGEDEFVYVVEDGGGGACEAFVRGEVDGAAPATLVEGVHGDGVLGCEGGEEVIVGVAVVTRWNRGQLEERPIE